MTGPLVSREGSATGPSASLGMSIETCDAAEGLAAINKPDMELVIWRRALPLCLAAWLEGLVASQFPDARVLVRPNELRCAVEPHMDACEMPPGEMRDLLIQDVDDIVLAFSRITRSELVDVRLERVSHDACWKFHRDRVDARLLTTYRGPATEWIQPCHAEQALNEQKRYSGPIERFQTNDVAIFKGSCVGQGRGIVHRSPPIAGTGRTRLLLCLNKRSVTSPEPWPSEPDAMGSRHEH
jgi:hypothetical protein